MKNDNVNIELIKNIVNETPNDFELGQKIRKFFREKENENSKKKLENYLNLIEREIVMSGYNDGWLTKWYEKKLNEIKSKIKKND